MPVRIPCTPAKTMAVYSPRLNPAAAAHSFDQPRAISARSDSSAAKPVTNNAGWLITVESSFSSGPSKQTSARSYPRHSAARSYSWRTAG